MVSQIGPHTAWGFGTLCAKVDTKATAPNCGFTLLFTAAFFLEQILQGRLFRGHISRARSVPPIGHDRAGPGPGFLS
jgi:hypothetical protein